MISKLRSWFARGTAKQPPDWHAIDSYSEISSRAAEAEFGSHTDFLDGPLDRLLALAEAWPGAQGARIMESVRGTLDRHARAEAGRGRPTEALMAEAEARVRTRFASGSDNDAYMIEVFEGRSNHHWRWHPADEEEEEG